ncbi:MAG: HAD family hydrolase [Anaerolineae bacterium]
MVFDLDGTLVRTEELKARSYALAARDLKPELEAATVFEAFKDVVGRSRREVATALVDRFGLEVPAAARAAEFGVSTPWQAFAGLRLSHYEALLADPDVIRSHQWPHNMALLAQARAGCEAVGLATMSHCREAWRVLGALGLEAAFDAVATRDDVEHPKPDPEIYLLVAAELGVLPGECLVVEDSPAGVEAAVRAGMAVVAVATPMTRKRLHAQGMLPAELVVDDPAAVALVVARILEEAAAEPPGA